MNLAHSSTLAALGAVDCHAGGHVDDDELVDPLRAKLNWVRAQVARLEDAANRLIEAVIASSERIGRQHGPAATGRNGEHK